MRTWFSFTRMADAAFLAAAVCFLAAPDGREVAAQCAADCDTTKCCEGGPSFYQFKNDCVATYNTNNKNNKEPDGSVDNEFRPANATRICKPLTFPPPIPNLYGISKDCTSNKDWQKTACAKECKKKS